MSLSALLAASMLTLAVGPCTAQVTTSQYNNSRTAATLHEKILTPQNVNAQQFGRVGVFNVDGAVYAQPLYVPAVPVPGKGTRDVLFVATEHDSVYAFDANRAGDPPLWKVSFLDKSRGVTTLSEDVVACPFIRPEVGITSTPMIDLKTGTLFVLARTMIGHRVGDDEYLQHLHALAITTGVEKFGGPKLITASVSGKGAGSSKGQVAFDALRENPRAALTLANNKVYLEWASSCDVDPYHGWVMSYDAQTLAQKSVLNVNPDGTQAGIWLSDTGPAVDPEGNLYVPSGNGTFDAANGGRDYGDSVLKLDGSSLAIQDYFTPHDQERIKLPGAGLGAIAYWNGHAFFATSDDSLRAYSIKNGLLTLQITSSSKFIDPGATPSISADGNKNAIVWAIATKTWNGPDTKAAVLFAFDERENLPGAAIVGLPVSSGVIEGRARVSS